MKLYSVSDKGIQYALSKPSGDSVLKILEANKQKFSVNGFFFLSEHKRLGHDLLFQNFGIMMKSLPLLENKDKEEDNRVRASIVELVSE
jgi:hypothetical protein